MAWILNVIQHPFAPCMVHIGGFTLNRVHLSDSARLDSKKHNFLYEVLAWR